MLAYLPSNVLQSSGFQNENIQHCKAVLFVTASCSHTISSFASARSWSKDRVLLKTNYILTGKLSENEYFLFIVIMVVVGLFVHKFRTGKLGRFS